MFQPLKGFVNHIFRRFGYEFKSLNANKNRLILASIISSPASIKYRLNYRNYYISLPLNKAKSIREPLDEKIYYVAVRDSLEKSKKSDEINTIRNHFKSYFTHALPGSASELLGLERGEVPELDREPYWFIYYPWCPESITKRKKRVQSAMLKNEPGSYSTASSVKSLTDFETRRTYDLLKSIQANGYIADHDLNSPVSGCLLFNENFDYNWLITSGFHRCSICHALVYNKIEVRLQNIIYRDDVDIWPAVVSGTFSRATALKVFDNVFYSRSSQKHKEWIESKKHGTLLKTKPETVTV